VVSAFGTFALQTAGICSTKLTIVLVSSVVLPLGRDGGFKSYAKGDQSGSLGVCEQKRGRRTVAEIPGSTDRQSAVRLLACIDAAGNPDRANQWGSDVVVALHAQSRLQALDFWMRNPDYLANELLTEFEASGDRTLVHLAVNRPGFPGGYLV